MREDIKVSVAGNMNVEYEFTQDWFQYGSQLWPNLTEHLPVHDNLHRFMEIGSFEGRSTVWIIENMMKAGDQLLCVDTWAGGEEHSTIDMVAVEQRFDRNIARAKSKVPSISVQKNKKNSASALAHQMCWLDSGFQGYDYIYIDGSHQASDVLRDCVMAWEVLRPGGIMVMDDYLGGDPSMPLHRPKMAIDAFMNISAPKMEILHLGYQIAVKKELPR